MAGRRALLALVQASFVASTFLTAPFAAPVAAANPSASLSQCANDPAPSPSSNGCTTSVSDWVNGNLGASKSVYQEGDSIPYRLTFLNLATSGSHTVTIEWDTTKSSKHAIDYIDTYNQSVKDANPCLGVSPCASPSTFAIPADPQVTGGGVTPIAGNITIWGGTITAVSRPSSVGNVTCTNANSLGGYCYSTGTGFTGDKSAAIKITFSASQANPVIAWGGHIATRKDWGLGNSAVTISGSPYHTRLIDLDGSGGNQDRSLSAEAVVFPGFIHIVKNATGGNGTFGYTAGPSPLSNFSITTSGGTGEHDFDTITNFQTYTVNETTLPTDWAFDSLSCSVATGTANGGSQTVSGTQATISLKEGEEVTCTYANHFNARPALSITKDATESSYDAVNDVIHYTIVATNTGNTTLAAVTVTDTEAVLGTCTPANGSSLAPGATMTCSATHTVTQADIDAGTYNNTACVDDGAGGATEACDDADVPADQNPHLAITKTATESGFSAVGDVIHYTITATNDGNVTLTNVDVTDSQVTNLSCTPTTPVASLAPNASITCTASHTITQADLDAGSFYNQACVDDGTGGAAEACDDVTTPGSKNPHLSITKVATEAGFDSVGDVIHYTITATNDGNVTLAAVTVTDSQVTDLSCTPANGSSLAPNASMTCTASHTITQTDLDAGSFYNQACVDDGAAGAAQACDDVNTPGDQNPHLTITKDATETGFDSTGDVIHYSITATNDGNVTLSNVDVTDSEVSDLSCTPTTPVASLAPGATITCTASHTITQADLDAGSFYNEACVDDGVGGAAQACDDVTTPGSKNPHLTISKTATETGFDSVGDVIHYDITATNDGNVTLTNVTVTDPNADNLTCTPANGSDLAPGDSLVCTADHTVTQADLDAGFYYNEACVDDGTGGADQACDDVNTPGDQNPHLTITKTAQETGYSKVGDVIHYDITATNDGNITLTNVTVTDPNADSLTCTPANGSNLAPTESIVCTASHTVTQADIDAGSYYNQACVDDGAGGAAQACDDVTTPGNQDLVLSITKDATESGFSAVGDVIHYTIVATNTGNTTLTNVDVTDAQVTDLVCTPTTPVASFAPGATISCTASHTITQADLDAGSYYNQACVDDGTGGADAVCDDVTTPGTQNPHLTITKNATETGFDSVGDVIHYSITATNDGNVTLSNVDVTDSQVSDLACTPTTPAASLAPGASITCTASHTITQADIDAGHFYNQACVDDGAGGADQACDDVTTPGTQNDVLSLTKTDDLNPAKYDHVGQVITYTLTATNDGNTTLHNVSVSDNPALDNFSCTPSIPVASLAPGASVVCTGTHTITQADLNAGSFLDTASATSDEDNAPDADDTVYGAPLVVAQITPTATTCNSFASGTSATLSQIQYSVKGSKINQVNPGVFFYWVKVSGSGSYTITQTPTPPYKTFAMASGTAVFDANCSKVNATFTQNTSTGAVIVTFGGSGTFYIGIKYDTGTVVGQTAPANNGSIHYVFATTGVAGSTQAIDLVKK